MSNKLAEYLLQQDRANKLKQAAIDEAVSELVSSIGNTFKSIKQLKEIAPDYKLAKLSEIRKLAASFGVTVSPEPKTKTGKRKGRGKGKSGFKLSDEKAKEILDFIGTDVKSTKEIAKFLNTENPSNAISELSKQGKIVLDKTVKRKKFWKRA